MAAFFAAKEPNHAINIMKLIKLMYLADRESLERYGDPITFDYMVSLDEGPILSRALNMINGRLSEASGAAWDEWMSPRRNHQVTLRREFARDDLDYISDADLGVLETIWQQFGHMDQWQLRDFTHEHLPEWRDPSGSSIPINEFDLMRYLGKSPEDAKEVAQGIESVRKLDFVLARR